MATTNNVKGCIGILMIEDSSFYWPSCAKTRPF